jgi:subtilase family serine protease
METGRLLAFVFPLGGTVIKTKFAPILALGIGILGSAPFNASAAVYGLTITNNTPRFTETSNNKGAVSPSTVMDVSIWLKPHNKADLDLAAKEMYDPTSRNYRQWLTKAEFMQRYGPTKAEAKIVQEFFTSHGMKIIKSDPDNFFVRAQGTAAQIT